ncbi:MAG: sensor histidine kinase [Nocardiopsaceae bacterium]|jgi:signal transduction histidine kinase|nr:sensor histidine kinase [Nocardiopsaceae bacterium]
MDWLRAAWRWWRRSPARDVVLVGLLTLLTVWGSYGEGHPNSPSDKIQFKVPIPEPTAGALLLVGLATVVLIWRNRWPIAVLTVSTAGVLIFTLLGYVNGAAILAPAFAVYAVGTRVSVKQALVAAVVSLAALWAATAARSPFNSALGGPALVLPVLMAAACLGGIAVSNRRAFVASIQARADDEARRRIDEERLRIARELHDVVAHAMSTINVQASAAATVLNDRPDAAAEALQAIRTTSKNGLRELRAILNVLRQADDADPTAPAPGLAQLDALIEGASQAGLPTTLAVTGKAEPLPAGVDLAAYRIIQESLTNAIRHAGPANATVTLAYTDGRLQIAVADTGRGVPSPAAKDVSGGDQPPGHGIVGMRERAATAGGTLEAGPVTGGGFTVTATLPIRTPGDSEDRQALAPGNGAAPGSTAPSAAKGRQS